MNILPVSPTSKVITIIAMEVTLLNNGILALVKQKGNMSGLPNRTILLISVS